MSDRRASDIQAPFGFTFEPSDPSGTSSSYPPPGPPLLDNNEIGYLESFFEDPSNVDSNVPSFLGGEYQGDSGNIFSNTSVEWAPQNIANASNNGTLIRPPGGGQMSASADVYAAAGILHGNTMRQHDQPPYSAFPVGYGSGGTDAGNMNGYNYNTGSNGSTSEYDLVPNNNGFYNGYGQQESSNPYVAGLQSRLRGHAWNGSRPPGPLNFGSDDNFGNPSYNAEVGELPDKHLVEATIHNFAQRGDKTSPRTKERSSAQGSARKRNRKSLPDEEIPASNDDMGSTSGEDGKQKRRRKSKTNEQDEESGFGDSESKSKKNKKKQQLPTVSAAQSTQAAILQERSPANKKDKASSAAAAAAAAAKERRENLTEEQKRSNHIQSEQKRRNLIKQGFEDLNRMVPELRSSGLSKSNMLVEAASFMRQLRDDNAQLRAHLQALDNG